MKSSFIHHLGLLFYLVIICLAFFEVFSRIYMFGWDSLFPRVMNSICDFGRSGLVQPSSDPDLVYELKPDLNDFYYKTGFQTNSDGLRDQEYSLTKPPRTFRVAVIGDSLSLPLGVELEQAYHSLMEKNFNQRSSEQKYEFLNFAVAGYQIRQYEAVLRHKALKYSPDLILLALTDYDMYSWPEDSFRPYQIKPRPRPFFELHSFRFLSHQFDKIIKKKKTIGTVKTDPRPLPKKKEDYFLRYFEKIVNLSREEEIPLIAVYLDNYPTRPAVNRFFRRAAERFQVPFLDASGPFMADDFSQNRKYQVMRNDGHPNDLANRIFAEQISTFLVRSSSPATEDD